MATWLEFGSDTGNPNDPTRKALATWPGKDVMTLADDRYAALAAKVAALSEQLETASTGLRLTGELYARATEAEAKNIRLERHVRELTRQLAQTDGSDAMRAEYRRGYGAGFHAGRRNGNRDPDQVKRRRRPTTIIPTLGHGSEQ